MFRKAKELSGLPSRFDTRIHIDAFIEGCSIQYPVNLHRVELLALFSGVSFSVQGVGNLL